MSSLEMVYTKMRPRLRLAVLFFLSSAAILTIALISRQEKRERDALGVANCQSNLRSIGQALLLYANDNGGRYPPRLEDLVYAGDMTSGALVCPLTNVITASDTPASDTAGSDRAGSDGAGSNTTPRERAANLSTGGHVSYVYLPPAHHQTGNASVSADIVICYEPLVNHADGMNVLYSDGRVEFVKRASAVWMISEIKAGFNPPRAGRF